MSEPQDTPLGVHAPVVPVEPTVPLVVELALVAVLTVEVAVAVDGPVVFEVCCDEVVEDEGSFGGW
jgi:hypothetical protein